MERIGFKIEVRSCLIFYSSLINYLGMSVKLSALILYSLKSLRFKTKVSQVQNEDDVS